MPMNGTQPGPSAERYTLVSFHAHPDDEALLTGGTLARAAAEGHRVVLVVATSGERGLTSPALASELGTRRMHELQLAAEALGVSRVVSLGYEDSGLDGAAGDFGRSFSSIPVDVVAAELAEVLRAERADVLTTYDARGGYGHPDHIHVHHSGQRAAEMAGTPTVLQATVKREAIQQALRIVSVLRLRPGGVDAADFDDGFTPARNITHAVDVRRWAKQKRAAMAAHTSQSAGGADIRTLAFLLRLPMPVFRWALGREWFVETGRQAAPVPLDDVFASLRPVSA
jgi:LmbE family N-acetylglucosaminyl deacetylase